MGIHQKTVSFCWGDADRERFVQIRVATSDVNENDSQLFRWMIRHQWKLIFIRDERTISEIVRTLQGFHCETSPGERHAMSYAAVPKISPKRVDLAWKGIAPSKQEAEEYFAELMAQVAKSEKKHRTGRVA